MKYALFEYDTENIGDEIQSIAARRFLPEVDAFVNRDRVRSWSPEEPTKIIVNGWFMHPPYLWPPKADAHVDPLLISMYIDETDEQVLKTFFSESGLQYLRSHGPVGARDLSTLNLLEDHGVESYFSGCLTLTLQQDPNVAKQDYILAVDVPEDIVEMIRRHTSRPVIEVSPYYDSMMQRKDRFQLAEYFLFLYQSAHSVVTTRLHALLPSLALQTPVLLLKDHLKYDPKRYAGLDSLGLSATDTEYLEDYSLFDVDNPPANPDDYLQIRQRLIDRASEFTGHDNPYSFSTVDFTTIAYNESYVRQFTRGFSALNKQALLSGDKAWLQEQKLDLEHRYSCLAAEMKKQQNADAEKIQNLETRIQSLNSQCKHEKQEYEKRIAHMLDSHIWKIGSVVTYPARYIKAKFEKDN